MKRRVIFPPADYFTPKENNLMTDPIAGDQRRATALVCHYGRNNTEGMAAILGEAADLGRPMEHGYRVLRCVVCNRCNR